ncbi:DUF3080 domain-containing protein [Photobacterium sp. SDRW27]|uniref:DUF3080 domain-containing protein n=1 Tax=Photobacterium obscurum TaxID=2829490 RepID=UPI0022444E9E|nr:DUF3080 domain-containing protein [Photobacterium obscurum]MCW8329779.1 DUF3080 domain-containing protein [Photobacterium obscurum]
MAKSDLFHFLTLLLLFLLVQGCDRNSAEASLQNYNKRLAKVLDVSPSPKPDTDIPVFAAPRDLILPISDIRIGLLDAYELRKCGLFQLIAERNSILGKVRDRTRQFHYELLFMDGLEHCIDTLPIDSGLLPDLKQFHQLKRQQLSVYFWNMLTAGEEWRKQLAIYYRTFSLNNFPGLIENQEAIHYLQTIHHMIQAQETVPPKQAERLLFHQQQIHPYRYFGQLVYSMARTRDWLEATIKLLEANEHNIHCGPNRNQQKAEFLSNVFFRFFVTDIQPYLADLDSQYRQIQKPLQEVLQPPSVISDEFSVYYQNYVAGELFDSFRQATLAHVEFWQRTFERCGIKLGIQ